METEIERLEKELRVAEKDMKKLLDQAQPLVNRVNKISDKIKMLKALKPGGK
jgi:predicted  nucleic acid-binding Zn-ribbon protein